MKGITNVVLAAACLASASAHTMLICSATSCETPGRVTLFLGTYHMEPRNANSPATPGSITVTTMGGDDFEFAFSATCGAEDGLSGTSSFEDVKRSMLSTTSQNSCRSQGSTSAHAGGKNIIDDNSQITCYRSDGTTTVTGVPMATESTSAPFCNYPSHQCYGFYYLVLDNVAPGDFTLRGWTTDYILQSDVSDVCGVIGHPNRGGGVATAISLSVAQQSCNAASGARCAGAPSAAEFEGISTSSVQVCNKDSAGGAMPGYMCSARCASGYNQVGSMVCGIDGAWTGFSCVSMQSVTQPCMSTMAATVLPNFQGIEYDSVARCGYSSAHGADCRYTCSVGVPFGTGKLHCNNGEWENNAAAECREIQDMPIAAMPAPIVTSLTDGSSRSTTGINVKWSLPTAPLCEQPAPDGCSGAVMFEIHVKTESGANSVLSCGNWNNGAPPAAGVVCMIPAGFALESKIYVSIIAVNRIGRSAAIAQTFYPVVVPSAPCYVDANALAQNPDAVGPHMRDNMDVFGKDWVKFWSPDQSTRAETRSAAACCLTCEAYDGCSYWTYHKDSFGCYLKHQDDFTVYSDQIDVGRISGYLSPNMHNEDKHNGPTNWDVDAVGWNPDILGNRRRLTDSPPVLNVGEHPHLAGVDFAGNDWVKYSNGRVEASDANACEEACFSMEECCYWTWSPIDPENSCYLKNAVPMHSKTFGYGRPILSFGVISGVNRCGTEAAGGVGAQTPDVVSAPLFRLSFERFVPSSDAYPPTRPELYMLGSGITTAFLDSLTVRDDPAGVERAFDVEYNADAEYYQECSHHEYRLPCFWRSEIEAAKARLALELAAYPESSTDAWTANGGRAYEITGDVPTSSYTEVDMTRSACNSAALTAQWSNGDSVDFEQVQETCKHQFLTWNGGFGDCSTYYKGMTNNNYCGDSSRISAIRAWWNINDGSNKYGRENVPVDSDFYCGCQAFEVCPQCEMEINADGSIPAVDSTSLRHTAWDLTGVDAPTSWKGDLRSDAPTSSPTSSPTATQALSLARFTGSFGSSSATVSWQLEQDYCRAQGGRLPTFEEICPQGEHGQPAGGCTNDHSWMPWTAYATSTENHNNWVYVGCDGHGGVVCKDHTTHHNPAGWIGQGDTYGSDVDCLVPSALTPVTDMSTFNERFIAGGGVLERVCPSCSASHQSIFYKRTGGDVATANLDWNDLFRSNWFSNNNNMGTNFELYSSKADMLAGENKWTYCNYNDHNIGFPRDCGPHGGIGGQWNSLNRGGHAVTWNMP